MELSLTPKDAISPVRAKLSAASLRNFAASGRANSIDLAASLAATIAEEPFFISSAINLRALANSGLSTKPPPASFCIDPTAPPLLYP